VIKKSIRYDLGEDKDFFHPGIDNNLTMWWVAALFYNPDINLGELIRQEVVDIGISEK
jgi:hypothetical protein